MGCPAKWLWPVISCQRVAVVAGARPAHPLKEAGKRCRRIPK